MASDGPPWIVGTNCSITLAHPDIADGVAQGLYVKPDSYRTMLPKVWYPGSAVRALPGVSSPLASGKQVIECTVLGRAGLVHADGAPSHRSAADWHNTVMAFALLPPGSLTLTDTEGYPHSVAIEEVEDRLSPLGGQFLLEWETRLVLIEV